MAPCPRRKEPPTLSFPVFAILSVDDKIILSGGGGGKKFGVKNSLQVYQADKTFSKALYDEDTKDDVVCSLAYNKKKSLVVASKGVNCLILHLEKSGKLNVITEFKTDTCTGQDAGQYAADVNPLGNLIATGGEDSTLRLWNFDDKEAKMFKELKRHSAEINGISFHPSGDLLATSSKDKSCRLWDSKTGSCVKQLTFAADAKSGNLVFKSCLFSPCGNYLYTAQTPMRGDSFVTKWEAGGDFPSIKTAKLYDKPVCKLVMEDEGCLLSAGFVDGSCGVFNADSLTKRNRSLVHDMPVTGLSFVGQSHVLSTGADYSYFFNSTKASGGIFSSLTRLWFVGLLLYIVLNYVSKNFFGVDLFAELEQFVRNHIDDFIV